MNYHAAKAYILDRLEHQLSNQLTYHSLQHTLDVLNVTGELCALERVAPYDSLLLKTAALYHDSGFLLSTDNHEELGCSIVQEILPTYGYTSNEIERICNMIIATRIPQAPQNKLEEILCDADLDYLGREDFYDIGENLFKEFKVRKIVSNELAWNQLQVSFLNAHSFFTPTNQIRREPQKQHYLAKLREWLANYV